MHRYGGAGRAARVPDGLELGEIACAALLVPPVTGCTRRPAFESRTPPPGDVTTPQASRHAPGRIAAMIGRTLVAGEDGYPDTSHAGFRTSPIATPPLRRQSLPHRKPVADVDEGMLNQAATVGKQFAGFLGRRGLADPDKVSEQGLLRGAPGDRQLLLSVVGTDRLEKLFAKLFDTSEFLSPYGLRALSAYHRDHPYQLNVEGYSATVDYEPAEKRLLSLSANTSPMRGWLNLAAVRVATRPEPDDLRAAAGALGRAASRA